MKTKLLLAFAAIALGFSAPAQAAAAPAPAARAASVGPVAPKATDTRSAYVLTPGDRINIQITGQQELTKQVVIGAAGIVTMLYVDDIKIAGKTVAEAQDVIEQTYIDKHILRKPEAIVTIETPVARYVYFSGEANKKDGILFPMDTPKPMTLVEAIQKAGYSTDAQLSRVTVRRKKPDGAIQELGPFDIGAFMRGRNNSPGINIDLQPDDEINIPIRIF